MGKFCPQDVLCNFCPQDRRQGLLSSWLQFQWQMHNKVQQLQLLFKESSNVVSFLCLIKLGKFFFFFQRHEERQREESNIVSFCRFFNLFSAHYCAFPASLNMLFRHQDPFSSTQAQNDRKNNIGLMGPLEVTQLNPRF